LVSFAQKDALPINDYLREDWTRYFVDVLGIPEQHVWSKMREIIAALKKHRRVAVKAGNGVSKSYTAAGIANCFSDVYGPSCSVITTAPTAKHLEDVLWAEIADQRNKAVVPLGGEITTLNVTRKGNPKWIFTGLTVRPDNITQQAAALQGYHNEWVFLIFDEASGVSPQIWAAAERLMTNERCFWLVIGNPPINGLGEFVDCFKPVEQGGWPAQITISVLDTPNYKENREVIPGVSGRLFADEQERKYGVSSPRYMANVLGEIPYETEGTCYGSFIGQAKREGRIGKVDYDPVELVHTARDIGTQHTAVIYYQLLGDRIHVIDYYEDHNGLGPDAHIKVQESKSYNRYGSHYTGWDIAKTGPNAKQLGRYIVDIYAESGIDLEPLDKTSLADGIQAVRDIFPKLLIDADKCTALVECCRNYKLHKIEKASVEGKPVYGIAEEPSPYTHGASALRTLAMVYKDNLNTGDIRQTNKLPEYEVAVMGAVAQADDDPNDILYEQDLS
jgi:hypothetical protein